MDHRDDWTYCLVIPRGHPLEEARATQSYRAIHEALAGALGDAGVPVALKPSPSRSPRANRAGPRAYASKGRRSTTSSTRRAGRRSPGARRSETSAASSFRAPIWKPAAGGGAVGWEKFGEDFVGRLAAALGAEAADTPWPDFNEEEMEGLVEQYSSPEWMEFR